MFLLSRMLETVSECLNFLFPAADCRYLFVFPCSFVAAPDVGSTPSRIFRPSIEIKQLINLTLHPATKILTLFPQLPFFSATGSTFGNTFVDDVFNQLCSLGNGIVIFKHAHLQRPALPAVAAPRQATLAGEFSSDPAPCWQGRLSSYGPLPLPPDLHSWVWAYGWKPFLDTFFTVVEVMVWKLSVQQCRMQIWKVAIVQISRSCTNAATKALDFKCFPVRQSFERPCWRPLAHPWNAYFWCPFYDLWCHIFTTDSC